MADLAVQTRKRTRAKRKELNEDEQRIEDLEKEVRELKAINRSLMKQLKKLSKGINRLEFEAALERLENEQEESKVYTKRTQESSSMCCPDCGKKDLKITDVAGRKFASCECGYRSGRIKEGT